MPIGIDRWRSPLATLLRAVVEANPEFQFYSYSKPVGREDRDLGERFWDRSNVTMLHRPDQAFGRFDLVHTASLTFKNLAAAMLARMRAGTPYLTTLNLEIDPRDNYSYRPFRLSRRWISHVVCVSEAVARSVPGELKACLRGIIPNGFDADYFDPGIEDEQVLPEPLRGGEPFVLFISALEPRKHPEFVASLAARMPDCLFVGAGYVVPGQGEHFLPVVEGVPNLHWLGHCDRRVVRALMRHAGVLVFPSEREGLPLTVIEALGMGLPVVAQPASSLPELIRDRENGRLIGLSEAEDWEMAVRHYLELGDNEREQFRRSTRQQAVARYDWRTIARAYGGLYNSILR